MVEAAVKLDATEPRDYMVLAVLDNTPERPLAQQHDAWMSGAEVIGWLRERGHSTSGLRPGGGFLYRLIARDPFSAAGKARELVERMTARAADGQIRLQLPDPADEQLADARSGLGGRLRDKLLVSQELATDAQWLEQVHTDMLWEYVYGKSQLQELQDRYGLAYEAVTRRARMVGRGLSRALDEDSEALIKRLADGLSGDVPQLARIACEELARHYVAGWWVECPLRYQDAAA